MDFTDSASVEKLSEKLYQIIGLLTCSICDKFIKNPVGLKCNHRFCEHCVKVQQKIGNDRCPTCKKPVLKKDSKIKIQQANLKMYIENFKKLMDTLKKDCKSSSFSALYSFVNSEKRFTELKNHFLNNTTENDDLKETSIDEDFEPTIFSTVVKSKISADNRFINHDVSNILTDKRNIVDETMETTSLDTSLNTTRNLAPIEETFMQNNETKALTTTITNALNSQFSFTSEIASSDLNDETIIENQESQMKSNNSNDDPMIVDESELSLSDINTNPTQSQYLVKKECITYAHTKEDKFDRVVKCTSADQTNSSTLDESKLAEDSSSSPPRANQMVDRSRSPELFLSEFDSDDSLFNYP